MGQLMPALRDWFARMSPRQANAPRLHARRGWHGLSAQRATGLTCLRDGGSPMRSGQLLLASVLVVRAFAEMNMAPSSAPSRASSAAASIVSRCPLRLVSRAACITIWGSGLTPHRSRSFRYRLRRHRDPIQHRAFNATKNGADPVRETLRRDSIKWAVSANSR